MTAPAPLRVLIELPDGAESLLVSGIVSELGGVLVGRTQCDLIVSNSARLALTGFDGTDPLHPHLVLMEAGPPGDPRPFLDAGAFDVLWLPSDPIQIKGVLERAVRRRNAQAGAVARLHEAEGRVRDLATIVQLTLDMGPELNVSRVLERIVEQLSETLGYQIVSIMLLDEAGKTLSIRASRGLSERVVKASRVEVGRGVSGTVANTGKPLLIEDIEKDPRFGKGRSHSRYSSKSLICVPLKVGDRVIGVLNSNNRREAGPLTSYDLRLLSAFAAHASLSIERARLHQDMERQAAELALAVDRFRALDRVKSDFITNVSHEYRTPVTIILGYLEILRNRLSDASHIEKVNIIIGAAQRLSRLIDDSTDLLRLEAGTMGFSFTRLSTHIVVQNAVQGLWTRFADAGIDLAVDLPEGLPELMVDPDRIRRALEKVLENSLKFTPSGGHVAVTASSGSGEVTLLIEDTGPGIHPHDRQRVFERFEQGGDILTSKPEGTGLGLPIARSIIERHRGRILVDPSCEAGCRIAIILPVAGSQQV